MSIAKLWKLKSRSTNPTKMVCIMSALVGGTLNNLIKSQELATVQEEARLQDTPLDSFRATISQCNQSKLPVLETNTPPFAHLKTQAPICPCHRAESGRKELCPPPTLSPHKYSQSLKLSSKLWNSCYSFPRGPSF